MRWLTLAALFLCALSLTAQDVNKNPNKKEPPILGPHWNRGSAGSHNAGSSPDMTYHGGPVLPSATVGGRAGHPIRAIRLRASIRCIPP